MGLFVVLEGVDGSGKDTQAARLAEATRGVKMVYPGAVEDGVSAKVIRKMLATPASIAENALLLQMAMQADQYEQAPKLCSALQTQDVVAARYWLSGVVYGMLHGVPPHYVGRLASRLPQPDLWLLIDITAEEAMARLQRRLESAGRLLEGYEAKLSTLRQIVQNYRNLWTILGVVFMGRFEVIDGTGDPSVVACRINEAVIARKDFLSSHDAELETRYTIKPAVREAEIEVLRDFFGRSVEKEPACPTSSPSSCSCATSSTS